MNDREAILASGYRIAVLCGGRSSEREVSLVSGNSVHDAILGAGLPADRFDLDQNRLPDGLDPERHLVLPVIHGTYGEDGRLSADLESYGFVYAGCDQASSVLCFDKLACKSLARERGLPVAVDRYLPAGMECPYEDLADSLGPSFILKPRRDGSSVGLHLVHSAEDFRRVGPDLGATEYLAEAWLDGIDLTVGILGQRALGVVSVHPEGGLYDYAHKYTSGLTRYEAPADIETGLAHRLGEWSLDIFRTCGCRDLARVDFRTGADGEVVFLEINTLPGMTPTSLLPKAAACAGMDFEGLVLAWARIALERREEEAE